MKKHLTLLAFLLPLACLAQDTDTREEPSAESKAYHEYRMKVSIPPYGLPNVKALIAKAEQSGMDNAAIPSKDYIALPLREKFTYNLIHAESYSQNCDVVPPIVDEHKKIFGYLPGVFNEAEWSTRQQDFLASNRDSVMALIKESAGRSKRIGLNYKLALVEINAYEFIPFLVEFYNRDHKDLDILTVLLLLMHEAKYAPFMTSPSYAKLYGPNAMYDGFLQYNKANEDLITKRALDLYHTKFK